MPASYEVIYRVLGTIVGIGLGIASAVLEAVLTPLHIGSARSPLAVVLALVGNAAIVWFAYVVTRHVGLALLPGLAWLIVIFMALSKTSEGDLVITGTWVGGLTFVLGCLGWAGAGYFLIMRRAVIGRATQTPGTLPQPSIKAPVKKVSAKKTSAKRH